MIVALFASAALAGAPIQVAEVDCWQAPLYCLLTMKQRRQQRDERSGAIDVMTANWAHCLKISYAYARERPGDPNAAAESAFAACATEENALTTFLVNQQMDGVAMVAADRAELKQILLNQH